MQLPVLLAQAFAVTALLASSTHLSQQWDETNQAVSQALLC